MAVSIIFERRYSRYDRTVEAKLHAETAILDKLDEADMGRDIYGGVLFSMPVQIALHQS